MIGWSAPASSSNSSAASTGNAASMRFTAASNPSDPRAYSSRTRCARSASGRKESLRQNSSAANARSSTPIASSSGVS
jgi:hypothetical protein